MRPPVLIALLALAPAAGASEVAVRVSDGHVDLAATAAPLGDVLDRLARQTGMKVVYEGPAPRQAVTLSIQGRTPAEAVLSVLEGSGVNFALVGDATGTGVETLFVAGAAPASGASSTALAPAPATASRPPAGLRRPFGVPPSAAPDAGDADIEEEEDQPPDEPAFGVPPAVELPDPATAGIPGNVVAPQGTARQAGDPGAVPSPATLPGFSASPFTPQPQAFPPGVRPATPTPAANPAPEQNPAPAVPPPS